ncbi:hypothetical protein CDOO_02030 [Corynebacterium doosanense CAU 212 = DSM 45436]|uniref:Uncharacterized protein n=2 Tax=Corynebacterium TaxID=1716 RepID=A0A097IJ73_9CORY|nr:hypothetical protein CDOO_02030 [Corynebacterium doosanense CAU 212 = DSM 45436]
MLTDGMLMLLIGVALLSRGWVSHRYHTDLTIVPHPADLLLPTWGWSYAWLVLALANIILARWHDSRAAAIALSLAATSILFWGLGYLVFTPEQFFFRGVIYVAFAFTITWSTWRGRRGQVTIREVAHDRHDTRNGDE